MSTNRKPDDNEGDESLDLYSIKRESLVCECGKHTHLLLSLKVANIYHHLCPGCLEATRDDIEQTYASLRDV